MDPGMLLSISVVLVALVVAYSLAGRGAQSLGGLFHPPALGWPTGVQEDDDFTWRWTAGRPEREPEESPGRVDVQGVHGALHRAQPRSTTG